MKELDESMSLERLKQKRPSIMQKISFKDKQELFKNYMEKNKKVAQKCS